MSTELSDMANQAILRKTAIKTTERPERVALSNMCWFNPCFLKRHLYNI